MIDLRSDTVTRPDEPMRRAMRDAEVGDDVFGEDPTVKRLQEEVADLLGKEAALFVPTGTMGNQIAIRAHTQPGDEVVVSRASHVFNYESGAGSALSGVQLHPLDGPSGFFSGDQLRGAIRHGYYWETPTRLVCLENTLNKTGGKLLPDAVADDVIGVARGAGLAVHLDGARLWNASVATGQPLAKLSAPFDSVNVCFSKGLGAPVGSMVAGTTDFVSKAHRYRKMYGGGMRQVGVLAAACLHAVGNNVDRLAEDHENARLLAERIADTRGLSVDVDGVHTNIVMFDVATAPALELIEALRSAGVLCVPFGPATIRATTHKDVGRADVARAADVIRRVVGAGG